MGNAHFTPAEYEITAEDLERDTRRQSMLSNHSYMSCDSFVSVDSYLSVDSFYSVTSRMPEERARGSTSGLLQNGVPDDDKEEIEVSTNAACGVPCRKEEAEQLNCICIFRVDISLLYSNFII